MASRGKKTMLGPTSRHPRPSPTKKVTTAIFRKVFLIGRGVGRGKGENLGGGGFFKKKKKDLHDLQTKPKEIQHHNCMRSCSQIVVTIFCFVFLLAPATRFDHLALSRPMIVDVFVMF